MVTKLRGALRREINLGRSAYIVTLTESGLRLVEKGRRKGFELAWKDLVTGDAALAMALNASVHSAPPARPGRTQAAHPRMKTPRARRRRSR
jgi:hypothetical protein